MKLQGGVLKWLENSEGALLSPHGGWAEECEPGGGGLSGLSGSLGVISSHAHNWGAHR